VKRISYSVQKRVVFILSILLSRLIFFLLFLFLRFTSSRFIISIFSFSQLFCIIAKKAALYRSDAKKYAEKTDMKDGDQYF